MVNVNVSMYISNLEVWNIAWSCFSDYLSARWLFTVLIFSEELPDEMK
jgi:hypothetical protein